MVKINWDGYRWDTQHVLDDLKDYVNFMENQLQHVREAERAKIPQKPPRSSEEEFMEWQAELYYYENQIEKDFPNKARYSFVVLLQIIIESRTRGVCNSIADRRSFSLKEKDLKGASLERLKTYLEKVAQVRLPDEKTLQEVNDIQKVRNCIVHAGGELELSKDKARLIQLVKESNGISVDEDGYLLVSLEYYSRAIQSASELFEQIFEAAGFGPMWPTLENEQTETN
mgnify:CR=1 FL=1